MLSANAVRDLTNALNTIASLDVAGNRWNSERSFTHLTGKHQTFFRTKLIIGSVYKLSHTDELFA